MAHLREKSIASNKLFLEIRKKWNMLGHYQKSPNDLELELMLYKKMMKIFNVGEFYYFIFVPPTNRIENISKSINEVLGYDREDFSTEFFVSCIHPDDFPTFVDFENEVVNFKMELPPEKLMKYKSRYNYRIRKKNGEYLHILQQSLTIQCGEDGAVLRNLIVHTDISEFKTNNKMTLSFIGLEDEPSFYDVQPANHLSLRKDLLTEREKEILFLLAKNKSSEDIAEELFISKETVRTHRKNILAKTQTKTALQLVLKATKEGWI